MLGNQKIDRLNQQPTTNNRQPPFDVLDLLSSLAEKSLVQFEGAAVADAAPATGAGREGHARYRLLETVRQYSRDRLLGGDAGGRGEVAAVQDRHLAYFLALAERAEPELVGPETVWWLDRLEEEHDNLRAALAWSVERGHVQTGMRLGGALQEFWWLRGYHAEAQAQLAGLLGQADAEECSPARAKLLCAAGRLARAQRDTASAQRLVEEALAISRKLDDREGIATALVGLGSVAQQREEFETARAWHEEGLAIRRELGDKGGMAFSLHALGWVAAQQGDLAGSRALHQESVAIWRECGDQEGMVYGLDSLGCVTLYQGDLETARSLFEQALALARRLGDKAHIAWGLIHLGWVAQRRQEHAAACALYEEGLAIWRELAVKDGLINALECLGQVARRQGDVTAAQERFAECLTLCRTLGSQRVTAWLLLQIGDIAAAQGDRERAAALFSEGLRLYHDLGDPYGVACGLVALAGLVEAQGKPEAAARLLGAAQAWCDAARAPFPPVDRIDVDHRSVAPIDRADMDRGVAAARAALDEPAFATAWAAGRAMSLEEVIDCAQEALTAGSP
jgi:tetratricopeptide (TPR) repeat protein